MEFSDLEGVPQPYLGEILGCPAGSDRIVTIVSKLVYFTYLRDVNNLLTYLNRGYNPFTNYHGHPSRGPLSWICFLDAWTKVPESHGRIRKNYHQDRSHT